MNIHIEKSFTISADDLANIISGGSLKYDEIIKFIEEIDLAVGDWDFTIKLMEYARNQEKILKKEDDILYQNYVSRLVDAEGTGEESE